MCTAVNYKTKHHYFGRNLDLEFSYNEQVVITPRDFPLSFRRLPALTHHLAFIGMATIADATPLYYDATNERGLSIAALNFPEYAHYPTPDSAPALAPFEVISYLMSSCSTVAEAREKLIKLKIVDLPFSANLPNTPLHWMLSDEHENLVIEPRQDGVHLHENPVGILTNAPPFDFQIANLRTYAHLSAAPQENRLTDALPESGCSRGLGAFGLPGDVSSPSRFVRAAFTALNSASGESEEESVTQFFHILDSVAQVAGTVRLENGNEKTVYSSCCNTALGIYYYTTYENRRIRAVDMHKADLDKDKPITYPLHHAQDIEYI